MTATFQLPAQVDTLLLDLDGTLLDLGFDSRFWYQAIPEAYGRARGLSVEAALAGIRPRMASAEGTLNWYCLDHWSRELGLDIAAMHREQAHRIAWLPGAREFLQRQRAAGRRLVLVTNSHPETLAIKDEAVGIRQHFDAVHSSHEFGAPKEYAELWLRLRAAEGYDPPRAAFIDDNPKVLAAARAAGIGTIIAVTEGDSSRPPRVPPPGFLHVPAVAAIG